MTSGVWYISNLIIDSHEKERSYDAKYYFTSKYKFRVKIKELEYGDYLFNTYDGKQVIFEYKTCKDFISSMMNKSLFYEVSNQTMHYEYSYLIIVGDFDETYEYLYFNVSQLRYKYKTIYMLKSRLSKQVEGALNRIYAMYVPIVFATDENDAFEKMLKISRKIGDNKKYGGITRPSKKSLSENPVEFYLNGIHGIGKKKAKNITNDLGIDCLDDLCEKKPSDFLSVDRVTENNVCEIWKKVHNEELNVDELKDS